MKKDIMIPLGIFLLVLFFGIISMLVFFRPKTALIRLKLKVGALLLSLTFMASCAPPQPTCYEVAALPDSTAQNDSLTREVKDSVMPDKKSNKMKTRPVSLEVKDTIMRSQQPTDGRCYGAPMNPN
jgi:hypothetical protein